MGIACALHEVGAFTYRAAVVGGLTEHEIDHVVLGTHAGPPTPDPTEVGAWRWTHIDELTELLRRAPMRFTAWFPEALALATAGDWPARHGPRHG
jgi:isopentenyl-diphosphate delta-isomerase